MCRGERLQWWLWGIFSIPLCWIFIVDSVASQVAPCRWARVAFCTTCSLSALCRFPHHYSGWKHRCAVFVFFIDENQRGCGGYAKALLSVVCGQLHQWLHCWIQEQTSTVFPLTGSLEYPDENVACNCQINSSFWGLFWRTLDCGTSFHWRVLYV